MDDKLKRAISERVSRASSLVGVAVSVAVELAMKDPNRTVTSVQVMRVLRETHAGMLEGHDPRWLGGLFKEGRIWKRRGFARTGHHRRPVTVWRLNVPKDGAGKPGRPKKVPEPSGQLSLF